MMLQAARLSAVSRPSAAGVQKRAFGALTSKPYAFTARPWELRRTDTVDTTDGMGCSIQVHVKGTEVVRVNPRENDEINEEWINDKTRFSYDGLKRQRLTQPMVRNGSSWDPLQKNWRAAFNAIASTFEKKSAGGKPMKMRAIVGPTVDLYSTLAFTDYVSRLNDTEVESLGSVGSTFGADIPAQYRFNSTILGLEDSDFCLIIGSDLPAESPMINARLRKMFLRDNVVVAALGMPMDLSFPVIQAGLTAGTLKEIADGKHPISEMIMSAERPSIIVGSQVFAREDGKVLSGLIETIAERSGNMRQVDKETGKVAWNGLNVLHHSANDCGHLELGRTKPFDASNTEPVDVLYLLGVNEGELPVDIDELVGEDTFVIVQGHHGDKIASRADVVLPGAASTEKNGVFVNFEGRAQRSRNAVTPPVDARVDWKVLRALSEITHGDVLPYSTESEIHERLSSLLPTVGHKKSVQSASLPSELLGPDYLKLVESMSEGKVNDTPFKPAIYDFYVEGNTVARHSQTMAQCSKELNVRSNFLEMPF